MKLKLDLHIHFFFSNKIFFLYDCSLNMTVGTVDEEIHYCQFTFSYLIGLLDVMIQHSFCGLKIVEILCKRLSNDTAQIPINVL
jgi:hypothetical protein